MFTRCTIGGAAIPMRRIAQLIATVLVALVAAVVLALSSTMQVAVTLAADTYLLDPTEFTYAYTEQGTIDYAIPWITDTTGAPPPEPFIVVDYPARAFPFTFMVGGLSDPTFDQSVAIGLAAMPPPSGAEGIPGGSVIWGYSQGAVVGSLYKRQFNDAWADDPANAPDVRHVYIGNPMRPNGGIFKRFEALGSSLILITFAGATPTSTAGADEGEITTYDIIRQYDPMGEWPTNPLFALSNFNALLGFPLVHIDYASVGMDHAVLQDKYGDTAYYLIPTYPVPILMPLNAVPVVGPILADLLDPVVRLLVEAGYDRRSSPGEPSPANLLYFPDPIVLAINLISAIPTGLDNAVEDLTGTRPLGTKRPDVMGQGAYGIGGPPVTMDPATNDQQTDGALAAAEPADDPAPASAPSQSIAQPAPQNDPGSQPDRRSSSAAGLDSPSRATTPNDSDRTAKPPTAVAARPGRPATRAPIASEPSAPEPLTPQPRRSVPGRPTTPTTDLAGTGGAEDDGSGSVNSQSAGADHDPSEASEPST